MIVGDNSAFAIECELVEMLDDRRYGHFRFWVLGRSVGDYSDWVDLDGCRAWLRSFVDDTVCRNEPRLNGLDADTVYQIVTRQAMQGLITDGLELYDPFRRFYISHLGMSAFDRFDVLLFQLPGSERLIWMDAAESLVHDAYLPLGIVESVARSYCADWDRQLLQGS